MKIENYQIKSLIYKGNHSILYRAINEQNNQKVILKILKHNYYVLEKNNFKREYNNVSSFNDDGIVKTYGIEDVGMSLMIIFEDLDGESLQSLMKKKEFSLLEIIEIIIKISNNLEKIHSYNFIHQNINPSNIILNCETGQLKIIDFGMASNLAYEIPVLINPLTIKDSLFYISPEKTGRLNRNIDYRTDFYSLGITFYQLLTNKTPFESDDEMEILYNHIAMTPTPPGTFKPDIPKVISAIVMKLLSKMPEERYQSIQGIVADLEECQRQIKCKGKISSFSIANKDILGHLYVSQKHYGREQEENDLIKAYERVSRGNVEIMLIEGNSGIGKTTLIREIYKPIVLDKGIFIYGKYDQLQRNIPYSAFIEACKQLIHIIKTEYKSQLSQWSDKIQAALKPNAQVIIDFIPELESIIGPQKSPPELGPVENQNRFYTVFTNFIKIFCQSEHPIIFALDDLQWIESGSLSLLEHLTTSDINRLFIIGAYRDNEVHLAHPLITMIEHLKKNKVKINYIKLQNLTIDHIKQLIVDSIHDKKSDIAGLAQIIINKTNGNPIYAIEFLKSLYSENLLIFDNTIEKWIWDNKAIDNRMVDGNIIDILINRIKKFNKKAIEVLKMASCLGNQFDLYTLSIICYQTPQETFKILYKSITERFIIPLTPLYNFEIIENCQTDTSHIKFRFIHDRIQEAFTHLISEAEKHKFYWSVGSVLRDKFPDRIFDIVRNLNEGIKYSENQDKRIDLARLNLEAGKRAKRSAAYILYFDFMNYGIELLPDNCWKNHYALSLTLHLETVESAYLSGQYDKMEKLIQKVEYHAKILLDRIKIYEIQIQALIAQNKLNEAIIVAQFSLEKLGVKFPSNSNKWHLRYEFIKAKCLFCLQKIEIINLPELKDPITISIIRILSYVSQAVYYEKPEIFPDLIFKVINIVLKFKESAFTSNAYAGFSLILCGLGKIDEGYRLGKKSLYVLENTRYNYNEIKVQFVFYDLIYHWKNHMDKALKFLLKLYQKALDLGEIEFAALSLFAYTINSFCIGKQLNQLDNELNLHCNILKQLKQDANWYILVALQKNLLYLSNQNSLSNNDYFEKMDFPFNNIYLKPAFFSYYHTKNILCYLFNDNSSALQCTNNVNNYLDSAFSSIYVPNANYYDSLTRLSLYPTLNKTERKRFMKMVIANQKKMKLWQYHAPENYGHKYYLVEAERFRVIGKRKKAQKFYDMAIKGAQTNEFINDQALANELAAKFYLSCSRNKIAVRYLIDALDCYQAWGATAKVIDLKQKYSQFISKYITFEPDIQLFKPFLNIKYNDTNLFVLLDDLIKILVETTGAQNGYLIINENHDLFIKSQFPQINNNIPNAKVFIPLNKASELLSTDIVKKTFDTKEAHIFEEAYSMEIFEDDKYIQEKKAISILCFPILNKNKLQVIIYLENNEDKGVFSNYHLISLQPLISQAAITIDNLTMFKQLKDYQKELKEQVDKQTKEIIDNSSHNDMNEIISGIRCELDSNFQDISSNANIIKTNIEKNDPKADEAKYVDKIIEQIKRANEEIKNFQSIMDRR